MRRASATIGRAWSADSPRGVLPRLLAPKRGHVEEVEGVVEHLVAATVDEVGAEHAVTVADEGVGAVPLVDTEIRVEGALRSGTMVYHG